MKQTKQVENKVTIYNNCIVHKGNSTLYFMVNPFNYELYTEDAISAQIDRLCNLITNLEGTFSEVKFTLTRFADFVAPSRYVETFMETVRLWDSEFQPTQEFFNGIDCIIKSYCLLAINIDESKSIDFNQTSIKEMIKENINNAIDLLVNFNQQKIDTERIDKLTQTVENVGNSLLKACPEHILMSYYIRRVFPSYNLITNKDDYDYTKAVLSHLQQSFEPKLNYFSMSNAGVELFGADAQTTYGSVIDIVSFPDDIVSEYFPLYNDGIVMNNKTLSKQQAKLVFNRKRADIEYEEETAENIGSAEGTLELSDYKDVVEAGLAAISVGKKIVESDLHMLVLANDLDQLSKKRAEMITALKDMDIVATFSPDQGKAYVDSFIKLRPQKYPFLFDLRYPMSFRLNQGNAVCDVDSEITSPIIGEQAVPGEAVA